MQATKSSDTADQSASPTASPVKTFIVGRLTSGNIAVLRDGIQSCLITVGAEAGKFIASGAQFPSHLPNVEVSASSPLAAAEMFFNDPSLEKIAALQRELSLSEFRVSLARQDEAKLRTFKNSLTPAKLRRLLAAAEVEAAKQKELADFVRRAGKIGKALAKKEPISPLKGAGYQRLDFPTCGQNKKLSAILSAIPANHKTEVASRRQKGYFGWSAAISPEAAEKFGAMLTEAGK